MPVERGVIKMNYEKGMSCVILRTFLFLFLVSG